MDADTFIGEGLDPELLPVEELADCAAAALAADGKRILSYGGGAGYTPLRELIGEWFGVHPGRVLLTNGSQEGLGLLARRLADGRPAVAEYPLDRRAERAILDARTVLLSVGIDASGMNTAELRQMLTEFRRPALIYTVPSFHNPTGHTMTLERRQALVELVRSQNMLQTEQIVLLEDDAYGLTRFDGERIPGLFDMSAGAATYSSSFSTTIAPGLRVGFMILAAALASELAADASATYISPALLGQATVFEFIRRGSFEAHVGRLREGLKLRRDTLLDAVAEHFPDGSCVPPEGGFYAWLELPVGTDSRTFAASEQGWAVPGTSFSWTANALRLSFASASPEELAARVERLATARAAQAA
ncbi:MAG TPA: PLP-dependent aminotransferase family protein [Gaiellaceae bacterium]|jgi:DNA-binding transcriptional MocR family regulator|nr:PLP-dependent aminotransferase family protein [Gaiellaceae bacterium]